MFVLAIHRRERLADDTIQTVSLPEPLTRFVVRFRKENDMTDTNPNPGTSKDSQQDGSGQGATRPDQGGTNQPAQKPEGPASGGEGAAGAGGPKGFGTGQ